MKFILHITFALFFLVCVLESSFGQGDAPALIQGQGQTAKSVGAIIKVPGNSSTKLSGSSTLIETGNKNILANPSFEHSTAATSWTNNGTEVGVSESTVVVDGAKSLYFNPSSETINLVQSSTLYAAQLADGVQCLAQVRIKSAVALSVCSVQAGTVSTTNCVTTNTDSKWALYKVPFICGATSNGISISSTGANVTGAVYVDDVFVGVPTMETAVGACTTADCTTIFSAKISSGNTISDENVDWVTSSSGTTTKTLVFKSGVFTVTPNCVTTVGDATGPAISAAIGTTSTSSIAVSFLDYNGNGQNDEFTITCQKQGTDFIQAEAKKTTNIFASQCGANCVDTFSAKVSSTGVVSGENSDYINGNCSVSTATFTCTFNSNIFTAEPNCTIVTDGAAGGDATVTKGSGSSSSQLTYATATASTGAAAAYATEIICQKQGADFVATRTIVGSFNEVVTSPGVTKPKVCRYMFGGASSVLGSMTECTTGTCIEAYDSCGTATPPAWATIANYSSLTWAAGTFKASSAINCTCEAYDTTTATNRKCIPRFVTGQEPSSSDGSGGYIFNSAVVDAGGTGATAWVSVSCMGEAP